MGRFSLLLPDETLDDLRLLAFHQGSSMNSIIRWLVERWLEEERKKYPDVFEEPKIPKRPAYNLNPIYNKKR